MNRLKIRFENSSSAYVHTVSFFFSFSLHGVAVHQRSSTSSTHNRDESRDFMTQVNYTKVGSVSSWYFLGNFIFFFLFISIKFSCKKNILYPGIYLEKLENFTNFKNFPFDVIYIFNNIFNEINIEILSKFIAILTSVKNFETIIDYNYKNGNGILEME